MSETLEARIRRKAKEQPDKEALVIPADIVELLDERDATIAALRQSGGGDAPKWWEDEKKYLIEEIEVLGGQIRRANAPQAGAVGAVVDAAEPLVEITNKSWNLVMPDDFRVGIKLENLRALSNALAALKGSGQDAE